MTDDARIRERLEYLRGEIEAEQIGMGEIAELQSLAEYIDPTDVVLLEWAGVPEFPALPPDSEWTVSAGRLIEYEGAPVFNVVGTSDARGYRYNPAGLDALTRTIADLLNGAGIDGKDALR